MARPRNPNAIHHVKAAVRARDGFACTECGKTNDQHKAQTGKQLQVHRVVPGSLYTLAGCVTLCQGCHAPQPKRKRGEGSDHRGFMTMTTEIPKMLKARFERVAKENGRKLNAEMARALELWCRRHEDARGSEEGD